MSEVGNFNGSGFQPPRFGKDHLTLADWRTGVLQFQQPRSPKGELPETLSSGFERCDGVTQQVLLERGAASEFPTVADEDVLLGLLHLAREQGFPDVVHFVPSQLLKVIRWPLKQQSFDRLRKALERYKKLTATFSGNWYDRNIRQVASTLVTGIVAQAEVVTGKGRLASGTIPQSHVQWTENFAKSLREGNLVDLDLALYYSWRRPGAKALHRHLNKVWHGGKKPRLYARDLKEIACGHLGMTDNKDLKRNFQALVLELEQAEYLVSMPPVDRYRKIGVGIWRPQFELHPDRVRTGSSPSSKKPPRDSLQSEAKSDESFRLVSQYHHARFGVKEYTPLPHELTQAAKLIAAHGFEPLLQVVAAVARQTKQSPVDDLYFGFAVRYFEQQLRQNQTANGFRAARAQESGSAVKDAAAIEWRAAQRQERREELLKTWQAFSQAERKEIFQTVLLAATSDLVRRQICAAGIGDVPSREVLAEVERRNLAKEDSPMITT